MATRSIVKIDEDLCTGCGDCVPACAEGAIQIVDGVAKLMAENLCDGIGACLGDCPEGAISIEEREADEFDETAVEKHLGQQQQPSAQTAAAPHHAHHGHGHGHGHAGCPSARVLDFADGPGTPGGSDGEMVNGQSELRQWPIQLHLVPPTAPYFKGADLLLAADCVAFSVGDFHAKFLKGNALAIACPKLDQGQEIYLQKLTAMIDEAGLNTITVMVMEVPCCTGLVQLAAEAASRATRKVPVKKATVGLRGNIISEEWL